MEMDLKYIIGYYISYFVDSKLSIQKQNEPYWHKSRCEYIQHRTTGIVGALGLNVIDERYPRDREQTIASSAILGAPLKSPTPPFSLSMITIKIKPFHQEGIFPNGKYVAIGLKVICKYQDPRFPLLHELSHYSTVLPLKFNILGGVWGFNDIPTSGLYVKMSF